MLCDDKLYNGLNMYKYKSIIIIFVFSLLSFFAGRHFESGRINGDIIMTKFMDNTIVLAYIKNGNNSAAINIIQASSDSLLIDIAKNQKKPIFREDRDLVKKWVERYFLIREDIPPRNGEVVDKDFSKKVSESFLMITKNQY